MKNLFGAQAAMRRRHGTSLPSQHMRIHDHFSGSANCVQCKGWCKLTGDELQVTRFIRAALEAGWEHGDWMPSQFEEPLSDLMADYWPSFRKRAIECRQELHEILNRRKS